MGSKNFADRLHEQIKQKKSRVVVGLDPVWEHIPEPIREMAQADFSMEHESPDTHLWAIREFCEKIIAVTKDIAVAFKPQVAFFERYGHHGLEVLERLLHEHPDCMFIVDCKRGDIGSTSKAYAAAYFSEEGQPKAPFTCDCVTHNYYLGQDTLEPYFKHLSASKGMFVLVKTSNPSSSDMQDLVVDGAPLWEKVASQVHGIGQQFVGECGYSSLGMVVGGTMPEAGKRIREIAPQALMLVPGMQTQGGKIDDAKAFCGANGTGAVFNFSRSVIYAHKFGPFNEEHPDEKFADAAHTAADHYRVLLNEALGV